MSRRAGADEIMSLVIFSGLTLSSTLRPSPSIMTKCVGTSEVKVAMPSASARSRCSGSKLARL